MNKYTIIPSSFEYQSAPSVDQEISILLNEKQQQIIQFERGITISLAQVYDDERQASTVFRPTFKTSYIYNNVYTGSTNYIPFRDRLYYVDAVNSVANNVWKGFPQYYEFDFFRPDVGDNHFNYRSKSAFTYNWTYYLSYAYSNDYNKKLVTGLNNSNIQWTASQGIPFVINNSADNGSDIIQFECVCSHGLTVGEYVELSISYGTTNLFQVSSLGNGLTGSDEYIFNIDNIGYTGTTFLNGTTALFKRVINNENVSETRSKYYVRKHKIITNVDNAIITKDGFEKNVFSEQKQFEYSSITPNKISRISQKTSSNAYNITWNYDIDIVSLKDNQGRPLSELYLTIINKGYSGYFNKSNFGIGLKQGWGFNLTSVSNSWWDDNNSNSNTTIPVSSYTLTNGSEQTFYYNDNLYSGDTIDGDFCEWNDYDQAERVVSIYYHKLKYNQNVFTTTKLDDTNAPGYYYQPHTSMTIRVFSDYVETLGSDFVCEVPSYAFYSNTDQQFRWRAIYPYGFIDNLNRGVDYPYLNNSHYPFEKVIFRLIPEGINYNADLLGTSGITFKPLIDGCE